MSLYYRTLSASGGVARVKEVEERGLSRFHMRQLLAQGKLVRPHRGWVALPTADSDLVFAATHGVVLTCMTEARRLGLWTTQKPGLHVAARHRKANHGKLGEVTHWGRPLVARTPSAFVDPIENVLAYVAKCQPRAEAHAVWESALRQGLVVRDSDLRQSARGRAARPRQQTRRTAAAAGLRRDQAERLSLTCRYSAPAQCRRWLRQAGQP